MTDYVIRDGRRIAVETLNTGVIPRKRRHHFVKMPTTWVEKLAGAHHIATYRLALHILHRHWKSGGQPFTLSNSTVATEGVARRPKWRALRELEQLGLITIERRRRKSPRVTVIVDGQTWDTGVHVQAQT